MAFLAGAGTGICQYSIREDFPDAERRGLNVEHFSRAQWRASNYAPPDSVQRWRDLRYGMFIHFGVTAKSSRDLSWGSISRRYAPDSPSIMADGTARTEEWTRWPAEMKLEKFDAREWVAIARRAGFRYIVVTTKHHEGFHMWDTAFSDFKITRTPFGRDYLKELTDACHEAGMPVGFYFAQREWYHPDYQPVDLAKVELDPVTHVWKLKPGQTSPSGPLHAKYKAYLRNVVRELCTRYGRIDIWWWDAVTHGGMFTADMWDSEDLTRLIRQLQPGIVINNRASIPGDFDTPERRLGTYQDWRPWETCMPISTNWSYTGLPARPFDELVRWLAGAACGDGNILYSWGPRWDGSFDEAQKQRLFEVGAWLEKNGASIFGTRGGPWKPGKWGGSTRRGRMVYLHLFARGDGSLALPRIPKRRVVGARMLAGGEPVSFEQPENRLMLAIPGSAAVNGDLVVELTFDKPVDGIPAIDVPSAPAAH